MISAHELGRWRTCRPQDEEESGLTSPCFAVGKSLCKNASVCPTEVCVATLSICRGPIDRTGQCNLCNLLRSDTPAQVRVIGYGAEDTSTAVCRTSAGCTD